MNRCFLIAHKGLVADPEDLKQVLAADRQFISVVWVHFDVINFHIFK